MRVLGECSCGGFAHAPRWPLVGERLKGSSTGTYRGRQDRLNGTVADTGRSEKDAQVLTALDLQGGQHWRSALCPDSLPWTWGEAAAGYGPLQERGRVRIHREALSEWMTLYVTIAL